MNTVPTLIVDHTAEPGGGELALLRLVEMSPHGFELLLLNDGPMVERYRRTGATVRVLGRGRLLRRMAALRRGLRMTEASTIVSNSLRSALFVALLRPRRLAHVIYVRDGLDRGSLSPLRRMFARLVTDTDARVVLVNSRWTMSTLGARARRRARVVFTTSGVVTGATRAVAASHVGETGPLRIVYVGRMVEWKGPDLVLEAAERVVRALGTESVSLTFVGSAVMGPGSFFEELRRRAASSAVEVDFAGQVDDVRHYLGKSDVLVHSSKRPEPFGQVIIQAAAAGIAILAPRSGGAAEILAKIPDALYAPGDATSLSEQLIALARDRVALRELAQAIAPLASQYSDERMFALFTHALASISRRNGVTAHERSAR